MIDAKSLRIGNWVLDSIPQRGVACQIRAIDENGVSLPNGNKGVLKTYKYIDSFEIHPIPITPEILVDSGFESLSSAWFEKGFFKVLLHWDEKEGYSFTVTTHDDLCLTPSYKYLHQLQNCHYWLEGEELEIKLPITHNTVEGSTGDFKTINY